MRLELNHDFIRASRVKLDLDDLRLGLSLGLITPPTAVRLARDAVASGRADRVVVELADVNLDDIAEVRHILRPTDPEDAELSPPQSVRKWTYLELKAAFEMRDRLRDPLGVVEAIYADFGYPQAVAPFVRYMPPPDDEPVGVTAMYDRWATYIAREGAALTEIEA